MFCTQVRVQSAGEKQERSEDSEQVVQCQVINCVSSLTESVLRQCQFIVNLLAAGVRTPLPEIPTALARQPTALAGDMVLRFERPMQFNHRNFNLCHLFLVSLAQRQRYKKPFESVSLQAPWRSQRDTIDLTQQQALVATLPLREVARHTLPVLSCWRR